MKNNINLIFISGWGFKSSIWNNVTADIKSFNILTLDLKQALDEEYISRLPDNSILIGWSFGGMVAVDIYQKYPFKFKKIILVASFPKFIQENYYQGIPRSRAEEFYLNYITNPEIQLIDFLKLIQRPNKDLSIRKILEDNLDDQDLSIYLDQLFSRDLRDEYQMIKIPVLHILGNKDAIVPVNNYPDNHLVHVISGAGHALFITHQEIFQKQLMEFIDDESI
jgi:pimeloyl-[acyl-carrier protein] methyl ester esterase